MELGALSLESGISAISDKYTNKKRELMRIYEITTCPKYLSAINIPCSPEHFDQTKPLPQSDVERKLKKIKDEIRRDEIESYIEIPHHMRNEYFDDDYESDSNTETESHLLDREARKAKSHLNRNP